MTDSAKNLADATRDLIETIQFTPLGIGPLKKLDAARKALAEYDARQRKPDAGEWRVTWEIDAFNAETPREAAQEAFAVMQRPGTSATYFTVRGSDGSVTEIDLREEN